MDDCAVLTDTHGALAALLGHLDERGYDFVTATPATHARFLRRGGAGDPLRDLVGWSRSVPAAALEASLLQALDSAGLVERQGERVRSRVRVSRLDGRLFLHSAYPTEAHDAVFLGPDSYRFARLIRSVLDGRGRPDLIVDLGSGAGVGGLVAAAIHPEARTVLVDVNPRALAFAQANAAHAGLAVEVRLANAGAHGLADIDLAVANPPFMRDPGARTYRDGGDMYGARLSLDWALHTAPRLAPGGRMILYTGSAIVDGRDGLREALERQLPPLGCSLRYEEIDPDIFGEELDEPGYADVERIAAIGAVIEHA